MDAVVAELAVAPVPKPVPVVMEIVGAEGAARRGALPEIVIEPLGSGDCLAATDGAAPTAVPRLSQVGPADHAVAGAIDIADVGDIDVGHSLERAGESGAASAGAHDADAQAFVGALNGSSTDGVGEDEGAGRSAGAEEGSTIESHVVVSLDDAQ